MQRDSGIDFIKFIAAILITNSHMGHLYPQGLSLLATGGAIGDALFFFCSGFTLFLKPMGRFDNWYKKRINRIYPTVIAWALLRIMITFGDIRIFDTIINGGGWFVSCIMMYYIVAYFIERFFSKHLNLVFCITAVIVVVVYALWERPDTYSMYGETYFKWISFFIIMLLGAIVGKRTLLNEEKRINTPANVYYLLSGLIVSIILYYGVLILSTKYAIFNLLQIITLIPLVSIVVSMYGLSKSQYANALLLNKYIKWIVMFIGNLCLEIYLTQTYLLRMDLRIPFPINYISMFIMIFLAAYVLRCLARLFSQTFSKEDYDWKEIVKAV
jgi:peptidoglycan/LPS O-acetylase OafA/YrhL